MQQQQQRRRQQRLGDKELAQARITAASRPLFGETASAPLKVQLKRKHWAGAAEGTTEAQAASRRCTQIFERQMAVARAAAAGAEAARDDGRHQGRGGGGSGGVQAVVAAAAAGQRRLRQQGQQSGAGAGKQKRRKQAAAPVPAAAQPPDAGVRQQLIEAYRQQKQQRLEAAGRVPLLGATAQSLAALVRQDKDAGKESFHR